MRDIACVAMDVFAVHTYKRLAVTIRNFWKVLVSTLISSFIQLWAGKVLMPICVCSEAWCSQPKMMHVLCPHDRLTSKLSRMPHVSTTIEVCMQLVRHRIPQNKQLTLHLQLRCSIFCTAKLHASSCMATLQLCNEMKV